MTSRSKRVRVWGLGSLFPRLGLKSRRMLVLGSAVALMSCASGPRPPVLGQADEVAVSPKAVDAKAEAPQAFAHAEKLRAEADQAFEDGDQAAAQILAERAIAAYSHAFVLVRLSRAENRLAKVKADLAKAQGDLGQLDTQQAEVAREAEALELKLKVARDAVPLTPNEPASADREAARLEASRALAAQARLLCVSAWLIAPDTKDIKASIESADALAKTLEKSPKPAPIDDAIKLRTSCLKQLTLARRAATAEARASSEQDELLKALSDRGGLDPHRDDRGIVVTLRGLYQGNKLASGAKERLEALAKVAKANPRFPLLVSVHEGGADVKASELAKTLSDLGAPKVEARGIGDRLPLVPSKLRGAAQKNARIELVFVSPIN
ncbi:MAG: hypothetical protein AB7K71_12975 [Polyangiaceae bacterium]